MRKWTVVLTLALGIFAPFAAAQTNDELKKEIEQLRKELHGVLANQAQLQAELARSDEKATADELEQHINALARGLDYAAAPAVNSGASAITIGGEFRARALASFDRDFGADDRDDDGTWVEARFDLNFEFALDEDVTTYIELSSVGQYGSFGDGSNSNLGGGFKGDGGAVTPSGGSSLSTVFVRQAWIQFDNVFGRKELSTRTGRQEVVLGNEYLFGDNDFFDGISWDGTNTTWDDENFRVHFLWFKLANNNVHNFFNHDYGVLSDNNHDDDELYSLYFTLKNIDNGKHMLDLYWIFLNGNLGGSVGTQGVPINAGLSDLGAGGNADVYSHYIGARIGGTFDVAAGLDYNLEVVYSFGDVNDATFDGDGDLTDVDVDGLAIEAEVGLTFDEENKFRVWVRFHWAQGSDDTDETGFIPLFPERHANAGSGGVTNYRGRYGIMDIIPMYNVLAIGAGLHFDPSQDWTLGLSFFWAQHDEDVMVNGDEEDGIGFEIDVFAEHRVSDQTTVSGGIGVFFADEGAPLATSNFGAPSYAGDDDDIAFLAYVQTRVVF